MHLHWTNKMINHTITLGGLNNIKLDVAIEYFEEDNGTLSFIDSIVDTFTTSNGLIIVPEDCDKHTPPNWWNDIEQIAIDYCETHWHEIEPILLGYLNAP